MNFQELCIIPPILRALDKEGYQAPSPIQEQAIPCALEGRDVLGCAQTGTGKTAAFSIPILQRLSASSVGGKRHARALILTPTRELALQIGESMRAYGAFLPLHTAVIFGGVAQGPQTQLLQRGIDVLVATPGRLNDLINQGYIDLSHIEIFVLDEADRMLDMGFIHDVERIISKLPSKRQTLFFSATMPESIEKLCGRILSDPVQVAVTPVSSAVETVSQRLYFVDKPNKRKLLISLIKEMAVPSTLVFTFTKHGADRVTRELNKAKIPAAAIHGDKSQNARQNALSAFKKGEVRVLVATDIAARGIDIEELSCVVNYDLPSIPETYIHRIGRTGRAGQSGQAISFCCIDEKERLKDIERLLGHKIPAVDGHDWPMENFELTPKTPAQKQQKPAAPGRTQEKSIAKLPPKSVAGAGVQRRTNPPKGRPSSGAPRVAAKGERIVTLPQKHRTKPRG